MGVPTARSSVRYPGPLLRLPPRARRHVDGDGDHRRRHVGSPPGRLAGHLPGDGRCSRPRWTWASSLDQALRVRVEVSQVFPAGLATTRSSTCGLWNATAEVARISSLDGEVNPEFQHGSEYRRLGLCPRTADGQPRREGPRLSRHVAGCQQSILEEAASRWSRRVRRAAWLRVRMLGTMGGRTLGVRTGTATRGRSGRGCSATAPASVEGASGNGRATFGCAGTATVFATGACTGAGSTGTGTVGVARRRDAGAGRTRHVREGREGDPRGGQGEEDDAGHPRPDAGPCREVGRESSVVCPSSSVSGRRARTRAPQAAPRSGLPAGRRRASTTRASGGSRRAGAPGHVEHGLEARPRDRPGSTGGSRPRGSRGSRYGRAREAKGAPWSIARMTR